MMRKILRTVRRSSTSIVLAFLYAVTQAGAQPLTDTDTNARILEFVNAIEGEQDDVGRDNIATELFLYVSTDYVSEFGQADISEIDSATIDAVAGLLTDGAGSFLSTIARTLGSMGSRAARAVPALQAALHRQLNRERQGTPFQRIIIGPSAEGYICEAFGMIGVNPEPRICPDGDYNPNWRRTPQ